MLPRKKLLYFIRKSKWQEPVAPILLKKRQFSSEKELIQKKGIKESESYSLVRKKESETFQLLKVFVSPKSTSMELWRYNPQTFSKERLKNWLFRLQKSVELEQQKYVRERHTVLGDDLAAAHFLVARGGKVKFHAGENWVQKNEDGSYDLPSKFVRNMFLHSADASNMNLRYEALENFTNLTRLKWLSFRNCCYVDDWFLDRVSGEYSNTLEYLDISDCPGITEHGLSCIYKLRNLRTLKVSNVKNSRTFEFMCLLLEDAMPNLSIEGINYLKPN